MKVFKMNKVTMAVLRSHNPNWFSRRNKKFFNDLSYRVLYSKKSNKPFLVRETTGFSDMFGGQKLTFVCINEIESDLSIGSFIHRTEDPNSHRFYSVSQAKEYLKYL